MTLAKLSEQANNHKTTRMKSEALLAGRIFDDRGNRMTPSYPVRWTGAESRPVASEDGGSGVLFSKCAGSKKAPT
jgi:hypothetical protein